MQTRLVGSGWPYARYDINARLSQVFIEQGVPLDVRQPRQVLSVVLTSGQGYLGLSHAVDNISDWAGGVRRFKREKSQVSRAEFKLLEAIELFKLSLQVGGTALDLGAAPGGWTRILRKYGMNVVAVDPAKLDPYIASDLAVKHIRDAAQRYLVKTDKEFDVILNDIRMDARDSARIMGMAAKNLKDSGWALITLKLPKKGGRRVVTSSFEVMCKWYEVIGARQLFHNRSEITVALKRTSSHETSVGG
ncbi:MAG: methyltransferase domain-containing protein [bacterium]|nr:methyltransferase domain-containing protein [bacterium]